MAKYQKTKSEETRAPLSLEEQKQNVQASLGITEEDVMGNLQESAKALGIKIDRRVVARSGHEVWGFLCQVAVHIDNLKNSAFWRNIPDKKRAGLAAVRVFIRQIIGETPPPGEAGDLATYFSIDVNPGVLGETARLGEIKEVTRV